MKIFYAKSNSETIQEHTDRLLYNLQILKDLYPNININWDLLEISCIYHDLGKINEKFQDKVTERKRHKDEVPHAFLSVSLLNTKELKKNFTASEITALISAIAYHHERTFPEKDLYSKEIEDLRELLPEFNYEKIAYEIIPKRPSVKYFMESKPSSDSSPEIFYEYLMIKGLLNRLDYAASAYEPVEIKNDFLEDLLNNTLKSFKKTNPSADWNPLQKYMIENRDSNLAVVAQTGMGKTEAGLLWIGNNKGFFTLPLKTAINAIYKRVVKDIKEDIDDKIGLLHSETYNEYLEVERTNNITSDIDRYYTKTKQLSMPLTICTLDQIFDFVYRYKGFELKPVTLSYSKVIIDEIQMYSPNLLAYIVYGLEYITKLGGKFAIVTATMPPFLIDVLNKRGLEFKSPNPFVDSRIRHSIKVMEEKINSEFIKSKFQDNKVLVICNTIKEAQRIYNELEESGLEPKLFHSGFIKRDRKNKEKEILEMGKLDNAETGIWVCTQVVEASLDIDFDILITELSDLNGLFQRMGRCFRNREFNKDGYNCFVFNGGEKRCSGVGYFIDEDIFNISKKALNSVDGYIDEQKKIDLIEKVYAFHEIKDTKYYNDLIQTIEYLDKTYDFEMDKKEAMKKFRDINNLTIIPTNVFKENHEEINELIKNLKEKISPDMKESEIKKLKRQKTEAKNKLFEFSVAVQAYLFKGYKIEWEMLEINSYESIRIADIPYDSNKGLQTQDIKKVKEEAGEVGDRMF
ncbi:CRISPR-associated endonuclease/helicase Cas3 [Acetoanaerobium pronyense]|uniref:CRISPR-associated endonuclease/helicase Cas3 n=1 Tax=Acetoanaerobium pronyense TaxID=1482736 RepID=A0ABS4KHM1_9FIRM|nr:CRISPR-associated helicase Cas3' [Acetoanaerobium pronyense]MBP2027281.1 CRISPR-associated endonuclease/helicase Cas3 [Acetoanaerobium pronyense]